MKKADASAKAPEYRNPEELELAGKLIDEIEQSGEPIFLKDLEVCGSDLIKQGITGKKVGETLQWLLSLVISGEVENDRDILLKKAEDVSDEKD